MPFLRFFARAILSAEVLAFLIVLSRPPRAIAQAPANPPSAAPARPGYSATAPPPESQIPYIVVSNYDKAIFQKPIPSALLAPLSRFAGVPSNDVIRDKQFRKIMQSFVPDCMFHYGRDMPLDDALDLVLKGSTIPAQVRDGRYLIVSGTQAPYLGGRGFLWLDLQEGIGGGAFYFHPGNGEPTPSVVVFSRQVKEKTLAMSQLPPAFIEDEYQWTEDVHIRPITTRYFITGSNRRILLEHDEDYCAPPASSDAGPDCEQMNLDSGDLDMNAALYLDATNYATNATAWMINNPGQIAWLQVRDNTCAAAPDHVACHIRMTRERTHVIIHQAPPAPRGSRR